MAAFVPSCPLLGTALAGPRNAPATCGPQRRPPFGRPISVPRMTATSKSTNEGVRIRLYGNNVQVTDSMRDYVDRKIGKVIRKYPRLCTKVDVHLSVQRSVSAGQSAEVVVFSGKTILRREVKSTDMYAAIDEVEGKIGRTLRKFKERREGKDQRSTEQPVPSVFVDVLDDVDDTEDDFASGLSDGPDGLRPNLNGLVKKKSFPVPEQTVDEAILCLDYLDHDFYLFRSSESKKLAVVYRRQSGGYGLLEPDQ